MNNPQFQRGVLLYQQDRYQDAVAEFRQQLLQDEDFLTHGYLALCLSELENFDEATEHARQAIHLAPDESFGHYAYARVMIDRKRLEEARLAILEAIRLDPYEANYFAILSSLELQKSRWREALEAANQGLEIDPEHVWCTNLRAQALVKLGDRAGAAAAMGEALARKPDDAYTHANQGWALLHAGQPRQAQEHFREALRLDPGLDWARAGIVESLKARNFVYRWMLAWFLWMSRLSPQVRWGLVMGVFFGQRFVRQLGNDHPELQPILLPLTLLYIGFVFLSWLAPSFFNLLLRLDRFGRHALSREEIRGANILLGCMLATIFCLGGAIVTGHEMLAYGALLFALLALPASAIYSCEAGWPRQAMAAITLGLLAAVVFVVSVGIFPAQLPAGIVSSAESLLGMLPLAMLGSQFAAMILSQATVKK